MILNDTFWCSTKFYHTSRYLRSLVKNITTSKKKAPKVNPTKSSNPKEIHFLHPYTQTCEIIPFRSLLLSNLKSMRLNVRWNVCHCIAVSAASLSWEVLAEAVKFHYSTGRGMNPMHALWDDDGVVMSTWHFHAYPVVGSTSIFSSFTPQAPFPTPRSQWLLSSLALSWQ